jgi:hypothetical protein
MGNRPTTAAVADIVYRGIIDVLKAPDGDRFVVVGEHSSENLIFDTKFLGFEGSPDFILILPAQSATNPLRSLPSINSSPTSSRPSSTSARTIS